MNRIQKRNKKNEREGQEASGTRESMMIKDDGNALVMQTHQSQKG